MKQYIRSTGAMIAVIIVASGIWNQAHATVGATTPFTSYEAENGLLAGGASIVALTSAPTSEYSSPALEASGHAFVQLTATGQSVTWTNSTGRSITAINVRSCIPDATNGGGINSTIDFYVNDEFRQAFNVNSLQNYCYEGTNYNGQTDKNPADGDQRGFWNDTHEFINGAVVAPGDIISLKKDAANTATFYYIDVVDLETPPEPLGQPTNSLSILDYGAMSNNASVDNTAAINNCFRAAQVQRKIAWIPPGIFYISAINGGLGASGITIEGAGPWYSTIYRVTPVNNSQGVANIITATSCTLENLCLDCNGSSRAGNNNNGAIDFSGNNWLVNNVWIQHVTSSFWCAGVGGTAQNCRTLSVWSDGGNFNNVQSANGIGMNLTYSNNFVRGTGDDAMAINSVNYNVFGNNTYYYTTMSNIVYVNNTAVAPWGGKGLGIYGGINDLVTNNLLQDTARYLGLGVGRFGVNGSDLFSAMVTGNTVLRCGGNGYNQQQQAMMVGNSGDGQGVGTVMNAYCASNTIIDSLFGGVGFSTSTNIVFQYNSIANPGMDAIIIGPPFAGSGVTGNAIIYSNTVTGVGSGYEALTNDENGYAAIIPIPAISYFNAQGVNTEPCIEGGEDVTGIQSGDWTAYTNFTLAGANSFVARVASANAGGTIEVHLDSPSGTLIGSCTVPGTGGARNYVNAYGDLIGTNGSHTVYLLYTGGSGELFDLEYFGAFAASPILSHQLVPGNTYSLKALVNGDYVTAPDGGVDPLIAQSTTVGTAEEFKVVDQGGGNIALLALVNSQYVCADNDGASPLIANRSAAGSWETYTEFAAGGGNIALRAMNNGLFVSADNEGADPLIADASMIGTAETFTAGFVTGEPPAAPNDLTATANNMQVTLNWLASPGATGYNVECSTANGGPYTMIATNISGTTFTNTNLVNGATYYYVITATNQAGESSISLQVAATPGTLDRTFWVASSSTSGSDAPANSLDGNVTTRWSTDTSQVSGQWFQVDMGSENTFQGLVLNSVNSPNDYPRGYQVYVSNDGLNWGSPVATGSGTYGVTSVPLSPQSGRYIRIIQTGSVNGTFWSIDEFNVLASVPAAPTNLKVTAVSSSTVSLSWNASASANGYNVKRSTMSGGDYSTAAMNLTGLNYIDPGLDAGTVYYYVITATNSYGESVASPELRAQTVATTPPQLSLATRGGGLQLNWPLDHLGWRLESQTNLLSTGLGTNWVTIPGSSATNQVTIPLDAGNCAVYFTLVYP